VWLGVRAQNLLTPAAPEMMPGQLGASKVHSSRGRRAATGGMQPTRLDRCLRDDGATAPDGRFGLTHAGRRAPVGIWQPPSLLMRHPADGNPTIRDWLGVDSHWPGPEGGGTVEDYLLSHARLIPRDIISLGNELNEEVLRQKQAGHEGLPPSALQGGATLRQAVRRLPACAVCANQISSDLMPKNAALYNYSELFTSTQAYISGVLEDVRSFVRMIGVDRFPRADLGALQEMANLIVAGPDGAR
jgi:hypothetical protein